MTSIRAVAAGTSGADSRMETIALEQPRPLVRLRARVLARRSTSGVPVLAESLARVTALGQLGVDWDGEGAEAVSPTAVGRARELLEVIFARNPRLDRSLRPMFIVPLADGGIEIEWRTEGRAFSVDITPSGTVGYLFSDRTGSKPEFYEKDYATLEEAVRLASNLILASYSV